MKVLKSMMCVAILMLLFASSALCQRVGIIEIFPREVASSADRVGIVEIFPRQGVPTEVTTPLSPLHTPVKVEILNSEGNVVFTEESAGVIIVPDSVFTSRGIFKLVVSQAGQIVIYEDFPS